MILSGVLVSVGMAVWLVMNLMSNIMMLSSIGGCHGCVFSSSPKRNDMFFIGLLEFTPKLELFCSNPGFRSISFME